jgi:hypothetical protein
MIPHRENRWTRMHAHTTSFPTRCSVPADQKHPDRNPHPAHCSTLPSSDHLTQILRLVHSRMAKRPHSLTYSPTLPLQPSRLHPEVGHSTGLISSLARGGRAPVPSRHGARVDGCDIAAAAAAAPRWAVLPKVPHLGCSTAL